MHGTYLAPALSRRHFILTAATAAGGFMIGIGATPRAAGAATVGIAPGSDENAYSPNDIDANITNICRCGTYERMRRAIHLAADMLKA